MKYSEKLRGECIGGAMTEDELFSMLEDLSFQNIFLLKRFLYRSVQGYDFYSITYSAYKSQDLVKQDIIYRGPFAAIMTDEGEILPRGRKIRLMLPDRFEMNDSLFILDSDGNVSNVKQEMSCSCIIPPEKKGDNRLTGFPSERYMSGCMICGADIRYLDRTQKMRCHYCLREYESNSQCMNHHYVCDQCHVKDSLELIRKISLRAQFGAKTLLIEKEKHLGGDCLHYGCVPS